ncbi:16S rRNA (guanine(527)-N(7))-methyltransferase RsmG [Sphingomonas sp. Leaf17]|uniref:16S rRNA (guanine(527)-N(7))-methyltransferase RsmG n=1 Tax=Sphingomonas sp. Leaf17 TaxID=1735683 RepID=UPI0007018AA0|nr:RsmG family class I SAM-dependent methyltransferase [Sphingomonas sp. Leaf17]KQM62486.1 16S rRNA (guanine(527)-N(7))-methyltransferase RsmG [Sphingomonas sp. Leaf17]
MTEDEARAWTGSRFGAEDTASLGRMVEIVADENSRQNLIAPSTVATLWSRHIVDSLQLVDLARAADGAWVDIGTGGGFPGLAVAVVRSAPMVLVEPRRKRALFLEDTATTLAIDAHVTVHATKIEAVPGMAAAVISARAVASIDMILKIAAHVSDEKTLWLLPRGRFDPSEMISLRQRWSFVFHVEQSLTDADSSIVVMTGVRAR